MIVTSTTAAVVLLAIPTLSSAVIAGVRALARQGRPGLGDAAEKLFTAAMILPVAAGVAVLALPPVTVPLAHLPAMPDFVAAAVTVASQTLEPAHRAGPDLLGLTATALLGLWGVGAAVCLWRLLSAHTRLRRIARRAMPDGNGLAYTHADVPAFAWSQDRIVLPSRLRSLPDSQLDLIIAHERAHQRRRDPLWFLSLSLLEAVLWFNPILARQGRACRMAAELACDAAVAGTDEATRRTYAQTLIAALKLTSGGPLTCVPAVGDPEGYRLRIGQIMKPARAPKSAAWLVAGMVLIMPVTVTQLALARGAPAPVVALVPAMAAQAPASPFKLPVEGTLTEPFGQRPNPSPEQNRFHSGVDFLAPLGTAVTASAGGTVSYADEQDGYGKTIEIGHAGGMKTRYAHLASIGVKAGDTVTAGQPIGTVGSTGRSTHPHLHFEIWQGTEPQDPAPLLGLN